ncbi:MAG TPA: serine/threonine-protein kinase [Polyangiaceae bacterium]|jgi:serine/threonine-protein kinase
MRSSPASELGRAGQIVAGKFRLDAVIGRGGMGSVWSATHIGLGHRLALKLIAREYVRSPEALRRFDAEARAAARLQSRHVVQVFDNGTLDDGTPFIAMELLSGENVSARIEHRGPVALADTVEIVAQCCKALGRAHAAGIVHRDIKPDNIFLAREPDEDADVAKILDFGVAKITQDDLQESQVTGTGALLGTPLYMSPEQIRGAREADQRADLYSLGLVVYTMLTGRVAITGETFGDILVKICTQPLPSLVATVPSLPYAMEAWFHKACAREPGDRYASAQELIDALRAAAGARVRASSLPALGNAPTIESAVPGPPRTPSFGESAAIAATLAAPAATTGPAMRAAITGAGGILPAFSQSAAPMSVTAAGLPRRSMSGLAWAGVLAALLAVGGGVVFAVSLRTADPAASAAPSAAPSATAPLATATVPSVVALPALAPSVAPNLGGADAASQAAGAQSVATPHASVPLGTVVSPPTVPTAVHGPVTPPGPPPRAAKPIDVGY